MFPVLRYRSALGYNYDFSYTSHAHGWSTGPTSVLTVYVLGLQVNSPQGATWSLAPHTSGLDGAEGGFTTPLGWFGASWKIEEEGRSLLITISTPAGTQGTVSIPAGYGNVQLDGTKATSTSLGNFIVSGGKHTIVAY